MTDGIRDASSEADVDAARALFLAYADSLDVDLCFQGFDAEMDRFPGEYQAPGGALFVAEVAGEIVGVVGLRPARDGFSEMKRLYLTDGARGLGLGKSLTDAVIQRAGKIGSAGVVLDTMSSMTAAQDIYRKRGFEEYRPARHGGHPDLLYFRLAF
jgi:putative acetyltransferase